MTRDYRHDFCTYLLLPAFQFFVEIVVALRDLRKFGVHPTLEVDEVLPGLHSVTRVLVSLTNNFIEMPHRDLSHEWLLDRTTKDSLHASVAAHLLADMIHNSHNSIVIPPLGFLDRLDLAPHDNDLTSGNQFAATVRRAQVLRNTGWCNISVERLCQASDKFVSLTHTQGRRGVGSEYKVPVEINN